MTGIWPAMHGRCAHLRCAVALTAYQNQALSVHGRRQVADHQKRPFHCSPLTGQECSLHVLAGLYLLAQVLQPPHLLLLKGAFCQPARVATRLELELLVCNTLKSEQQQLLQLWCCFTAPDGLPLVVQTLRTPSCTRPPAGVQAST